MGNKIEGRHKLTGILLLVMALFITPKIWALETTVPPMSHHAVSVELGGAGIAGSFFYSYRFDWRWLAVNAGLGMAMPLSVSFYTLGNQDHNLELLAGLAFSNSSYKENRAIPELGMGYCYWPDHGGWHFRATLYALGIQKGLLAPADGPLVWGGVSLGYAF